MAALPPASQSGNRILVLGADLAVVEPVVTRLERWGAAPMVLFDVPSAMNALVRARPYLVVLDAGFGPDLSGLLAALQGDRALPVDSRRPIPTLLLTGPDTPPLESVLGPGLSVETMRSVRPIRYDQPDAVERALREALQVAGLSSYAPLAFEPTLPAAIPSAPEQRPVATPVPAPRPPNQRLTPLLFGLALLALLAVPALLTMTRLRGPQPAAQPSASVSATTPSAGTPVAPTPPGTATTPTSPGAAATPAGPAGAGPAVNAAPPATAAATPPGTTPGTSAAPAPVQTGPFDPVLDPLRNLLGPLLGQPGAPAQPAQPAQPGQPSVSAPPGGTGAPGSPSGAPAVRPPWQPPAAPRLPFCGAVEQWRPLVRETLSEAWSEGRLDGPASALDDDLVLSLILRESTGDPRALNAAGADEVGLLQLLPATFAEQLGRPASEPAASLVQAMQDPRTNLRAGVRYLARAFASQGGDLYWSLVAYRAGLEGASAWRRAGGTPGETDARIRAILETYARHRPDVRLVFVPSPGAPAPATVRPVLPAGSC